MDVPFARAGLGVDIDLQLIEDITVRRAVLRPQA